MELEDKAFYSTTEFGAALGYTSRYVRKLITAGLIEVQRESYAYRIPREEAVRWGLLDKNGVYGVST